VETNILPSSCWIANNGDNNANGKIEIGNEGAAAATAQNDDAEKLMDGDKNEERRRQSKT
jgi:hypothetical protein